MKRFFAGIVSAFLMISLLLPGWSQAGENQAGWSQASAAETSALLDYSIAYNIDLEMDKAREEKTVEHYGEGIRDLVEDANKNNVNAPDSKPTAQSTYERSNPVIDVLPKERSTRFSKEELQDMKKGERNRSEELKK
jgi:hypothetical protein